ncbi:MAG: hypothetical protein U0941_23800 [Planctomycetaceae bacterium]
MNLNLSEGSTPEEATVWLGQLVRDFGLGFHLDTAPAEYVFPGGRQVFTPDQCSELMKSLSRLFRILGEARVYDVGAEASTALLAESLGRKPPLEFHDPDFQQRLLHTGTREELIAWLCWNDPNGIYTDEASWAEDRPPLTLELARQILRDQRERDSSK